MARPTLLDRSFQLAYIVAYRMMRVYWRLSRKTTHGALVTLWHEDRVLLVRNSYVPYYSLPGGYLRKNETGREAAIRELGEEIGITPRAEELVPVVDETHRWEGKLDRVEIFELELAERPEVAIDYREVVKAEWVSPAVALTLNLFPPLRRAIEARMRRAGHGGQSDRGQSDRA